MRAVLWTIFACLALLVVTVFVFIYSGTYDVAAVHPDSPFVARVVHEIADRYVATQLDAIAVPAGYDSVDNIAAGATLYGQTCVVCHGGPGLEPSRIAEGLNPAPPNFFRAGRHFDPKETFWFVSNGVKMTGMPGFSRSLSEPQIWSLVAFLSTTSGMSAADFAAKTGVSAAPASPARGTATSPSTTNTPPASAPPAAGTAPAPSSTSPPPAATTPAAPTASGG